MTAKSIASFTPALPEPADPSDLGITRPVAASAFESAVAAKIVWPLARAYSQQPKNLSLLAKDWAHALGLVGCREDELQAIFDKLITGDYERLPNQRGYMPAPECGVAVMRANRARLARDAERARWEAEAPERERQVEIERKSRETFGRLKREWLEQNGGSEDDLPVPVIFKLRDEARMLAEREAA